jgi:protease-4
MMNQNPGSSHGGNNPSEGFPPQGTSEPGQPFNSVTKAPQPAGIHKRRSWGFFGCLWVAMSGILLVSLLANLIMFVILWAGSKTHLPTGFGKSSSSLEAGYVETVLVEGSKNQKVAVIEIYGVISYDIPRTGDNNMVDEVVDKLRIAAEDATVKAIILDVDSPGGEVNASDVLYHEIKKVRDETNKPVVAHFRSVAASGAYYAAMGSSYIVANRMTITGSIGVILQTLQYKELFQKVGLKTYTFKSGKFKDMLSPTREPTQEELDYVQAFIMQSYDVFADIVEQERGFQDREKFRREIADGRIFSGLDALREKVVDQLGYFEDAQRKAMELAGITDAQVFRYDPVPSLSRIFRALGVELGQTKRVEIGLAGFTQGFVLTPGKAYYLLPTVVIP